MNDGARRRNRRLRWEAKGLARVAHPHHGTVVVPCASPLSAVMCAAEVWRCRWVSIIADTEVTAALPCDTLTKTPYRI